MSSTVGERRMTAGVAGGSVGAGTALCGRVETKVLWKRDLSDEDGAT